MHHFGALGTACAGQGVFPHPSPNVVCKSFFLSSDPQSSVCANSCPQQIIFIITIRLPMEFVNMLLAIFLLHMKMNLLGITELGYYEGFFDERLKLHLRNTNYRA